MIEIVMTGILLTILLILCGIAQTLTVNTNSEKNWLPLPSNPAKRQFELYALYYTAVWIGVFAIVIIGQYYETYDENSYMVLCTSLVLPFLLQPILYPLEAEKHLPLAERYSFKANVWLAIFSFIGSYWYTHYFYTVLKAKYTFPAHRLNDVPIALYFSAHFYFVTYHTFSNMILRKIETTYKPSTMRTVFYWLSVLAFSYFTAFMETLTISSFPYYSFEDKFMAFTLGSAFYGIYFIVSFPTYRLIDENLNINDKSVNAAKPYTLYQTIMEAMGVSMIVLLLLDFCRIYCGIDLHISGVAYYIYGKN